LRNLQFWVNGVTRALPSTKFFRFPMAYAMTMGALVEFADLIHRKPVSAGPGCPKCTYRQSVLNNFPDKVGNLDRYSWRQLLCGCALREQK